MVNCNVQWYCVRSHQKEQSSLKLRQRQEIYAYLQQHSQRDRASGAQDPATAVPDDVSLARGTGASVLCRGVPQTAFIPPFENVMPAPFAVQPAQQHLMMPPMQVAAQNLGMMMLPGSDPTLYTTVAGQDLGGSVPGDAPARQPPIRKLFDPHTAPGADDAWMRQVPEYFVNAHHTYSDHAMVERSVEPGHARRESDSGVHTQEVNMAALVQGARLQSSHLTPQGSPVMQHKLSHGKPTSSTSLAGLAPMMQPRVLPAPHCMMAQHPMSAYTPQQLQMLQQQQYAAQNMQLQVQQQQMGGFAMQPPQQKPQFIPQPQLRGQLMDSNALANYMQYQQMATSGAVPPQWTYMPSVAPGQPSFTAGVPPTFVHAKPALAAHPVITQSAPMIPVAQPTAGAPVSIVPPVTNAT